MPEKPRANRKNNNVPSPDNKLVAIARIINARGLHGELKAESLSDASERFKDLRTVLIEFSDGSVVEHTVERTRLSGDAVFIKLKNVTDRTTAERFKGAFMCIDSEDVAPLPEDSFYIFDVEGMEVCDREGKTIGRVLRIERYPANDVIVVGMKNNDIMIPAVREYVRNVDVKRKRMTVIIPEGLPTYPKGKL